MSATRALISGRQGSAAPDHDHVRRRVGVARAGFSGGGPEAAPDPVTLGRVPHLLGDREAEAQAGAVGRVRIAQAALQGHALRVEAAAGGGGQEFGAFRQSPKGAPKGARAAAAHRAAVTRTGACGRGRGAPRSPCGRPWSPCAPESRGGACERACSVDTSSSRPVLRSQDAGRGSGQGALRRFAHRLSRKNTVSARFRALRRWRGLWRMGTAKSTRRNRRA